MITEEEKELLEALKGTADLVNKNMVNTMHKFHDNRKAIKEMMLCNFQALLICNKRMLEDKQFLKGEKAIEQLKDILMDLLANNLILSGEVYRLAFKDEIEKEEKKENYE